MCLGFAQASCLARRGAAAWGLTFKATQLDEVLEHQSTDVDGPARWGVVHGSVFSSNLVVEHSGALSPTCVSNAKNSHSSTLLSGPSENGTAAGVEKEDKFQSRRQHQWHAAHIAVLHYLIDLAPGIPQSM